MLCRAYTFLTFLNLDLKVVNCPLGVCSSSVMHNAASPCLVWSNILHDLVCYFHYKNIMWTCLSNSEVSKSCVTCWRYRWGACSLVDSLSGHWHVAAACLLSPSVDRRPVEQLYIPAALSATKQKSAASRNFSPGVLLGPLRVPLHALITVHTEPILDYPTWPARAPLSFFDHEAQ